MNKKVKKGFTLVELIVVITILAILGTIAFLSMQGYSSNARDSNRTTDLSSIKTSLELFITKTGNYPLPSNYVGVTYSGGLVWNQGTFGNEPFKQLGDISKLPTDPLTNNEYTYSVTNTKTEYEISGVYEGSISKNKSIINDTYAVGTLQGTTKILGTYNGVQVYVSSGTSNYTIFTPTITSSDLISSVDIQNIITNNKLVLNGSTKLPSSYQSSNFKDGSVNLGLTNILISTGSLTELKAKTQSGTNLRLEYLNNLKSILSGSTMENSYQEVINNPTNDTLALNIISGKYKPTINILAQNSTNNTPIETNSCASQPNITNGTGYIENPSSQNQEWTYSANPTSCQYNCSGGYTGSGCSTAPTECSGTMTELTLSNGQIWSCNNIGATTVWNGIDSFSCNSTTDCSNKPSWAGDYYQWGRNDTGWTDGLSNTSYAWGGSPYDTTSTNESSTTNIGRQGPCPTGWHIPSLKDWQDLCDNVTGTTCSNPMLFNSLISSKIKIPLSGYRDGTAGNYLNQGSNSYYWSSSSTSTDGLKWAYLNDNGEINYSLSNIYLINGFVVLPNNNKELGYNIRCIKN